MNKRILIITIVIVGAIAAFLTFNQRNTSNVEVQDSSSPDAQAVFEQAQQLEASGNKIEAKEAYKRILNDYPDFDHMEQVQNKVGNLSIEIILSNQETPQTVIHEVKSGDTLGKLAKQYNTTIELIKKSNDLPNDTIRLGQRLRIWSTPFHIFVDKSQNVLMLKSGNELMKVYHVSTGENDSTPAGTFKITTKLVDPVWFKSGAIIPPDSPSNVLGSRWMGFDIPGYGIHGTTEPDKIGQQVTAGCVRMRNEEVEELYSMIPIGTEVVVVD